jgi:hypothetical protein
MKSNRPARNTSSTFEHAKLADVARFHFARMSTNSACPGTVTSSGCVGADEVQHDRSI